MHSALATPASKYIMRFKKGSEFNTFKVTNSKLALQTTLKRRAEEEVNLEHAVSAIFSPD
jgi:hypothetical protein